MPSHRHVLAVLVVALLVAPAVGSVVARPPPEALCGTCSLGEEEHWSGSSVDVDAANSSLSVELFENGSSYWTERVRVARGADELAANESFRTEVLDRAFHRHAVDDADRTDVRTRVENRTLVTTYRVPAFGHRSLGVLVVDEFDRTTRDSWVYVGAGRVTLSAPDGHRLVDGPAEPADRTTETAVVWTDPNPTGDYGPHVEGRLAFADDDATLAGLRADAATALAHGSDRLFGAAAFALLPTLLVSATGVLYARSAALGGWSLGPSLAAVAVMLAALVGTVTAVLYALFVAPMAGDLGVWPLLLVPSAALFALGYCASRDDVGCRLVGGAALVPWVGVLALALNGQLLATGVVTTMLVALGALAATAVGVPGYLVGRRLAVTERR